MALTVDSTIGDLLDNPKVEAYFKENLSMVTSHPNLAMAKSMSFKMVAMMPQAGISPDKVDALAEYLMSLGE